MLAWSDPGTGLLYHVYHQYTIKVNDGKRDELKKHLEENGVSTMIYYPVPLHKMKVFDGRSKVHDGLEESESASFDVLSLPIEPLQTEADTFSVINCIKEYFRTI
ncbi:MAG: DegT/DnrJ/EryC1/StrS family aminotransferase [Candidatus Kuenenia sp.]|nr:DegT/DnrJ/EryC1/StrS family aminotransferase [Candidatus Kuenenia sp.]